MSTVTSRDAGRGPKSAFAMRAGAVVAAAAVASALTVSAGASTAGTLNVCPTGCKFSQIAPAIAAAKSGDTVKVAAGTYTGGFTIVANMKLVGAGAHATIIRGGGPVVTIGSATASTKLTVSIAGVTITGGENHAGGAYVHGGGVLAPDSNATVAIDDAVITDNRAEPTVTTISSQFSPPCPNGRQCPYAEARGGGVYNAGTMTVSDTTVTDNQVAGVASSADGGGIYSADGSRLTLIDDTVAGNQAIASIPNGRFAIGGGIFVDIGGALTVKHSRVSDNRARLTSALPVSVGGPPVGIVAQSGGIFVNDDAPTTVENTTITGNSVSATDPSGPANAINAAVAVGYGRLIMRNSVISNNRVNSTYVTDGVSSPSATAFDPGGQGATFEADGGGTISHTEITDNTSSSTSPDGPTAENSGLFVGIPGSVSGSNTPPGPARVLTVQDSVISGNTVAASSPGGSATVQGAGIVNLSLLILDNVQVRDNSGEATGKSGIAEGAGIWNGGANPGTTVRLTLKHTVVTHNSLKASAGVTVNGGGLFTTSPVTLKGSTISANTPDECSGLAC
jgi:hypothetical protein